MEALVITGYQRGIGDPRFKQILAYIKEGNTTELKDYWLYVAPSGNSNVDLEKRRRRYAEWMLYSTGVYINKDTGSGQVVFTSDTPYEDLYKRGQKSWTYKN